MNGAALRRRAAIGVAVVALLAALGAGALHLSTRVLRAQVIEALGPDSEVGEIRLGFGRIEIDSLRVRAPAGWPAPELLRAARVVVTPDLRSLMSSTVRVSSVSIDDAYLSVLRTADGRMRVLPGVASRAKSGEAGAAARPARNVIIGRVALRNAALDFFDASVARPALKLRAEQLAIEVDDLHLPGLEQRSRLRIAGVVKGAPARGAARDGTVAIDGWIVFANRDSQLASRLRGVDLVALQPYLIKSSETGVRRGSLDLDLKSTVRGGRVDAPGLLTLTGLELAPAGSGPATFMGLPRQAVVALMKDGRDRIVVNFALRGNLDDPKFSINEDVAVRIAASLAQQLGVSLEGVVRGLGGAGGKSTEAAGEAAKALGSALRGLFGR